MFVLVDTHLMSTEEIRSIRGTLDVMGSWKMDRVTASLMKRMRRSK
jgi:hypothetical protein